MDKNLLNDAIKNLETTTKNNLFKTGFIELDSMLKGIDTGHVIVIGGRPCMGKSSFAISICLNLLKENKKICYYTLDMKKEKFVTKLLLTKLKQTKIDFDNKKNTEKIAKAIEFFCNKELFIEDKTNLTIEEFENGIKKHQPDIVFVDYVQILKMPKAPNLTEATNLAIQEIKRIAIENNTIIVLLSQLSRGVESRFNKMPMLSDLRNGSLLEEISDVVLLIYRDAYYNAESERKDYADILIAKNQFGSTGIISLKYNAPFFNNPDYLKNLKLIH